MAMAWLGHLARTEQPALGTFFPCSDSPHSLVRIGTIVGYALAELDIGEIDSSELLNAENVILCES